ncbi:CoA transferase [Comamonas sp. Y33R10-2]|uniref:CaiB/BaiF CoA transferase family protein n=1 Tax=Comamonas sp. Y33R10-2 TaxID=2853257 RepID=UPI001C5CA083|nr:CoA transferase [Comamonas sp. Y33R10-2]QXZ10705.1 CoA transferase [Comamonas sp. Y33R10-2]
MSMAQSNPSAKPLAGLRVLDLTHAAAGPFAAMFLADMGAEVLKIEKPKGGDGARTMGVPMPHHGPKDSDYFVSLNRNKKGLIVDLTLPEGVALAKELVKHCDVVLENFRPDVMSRLGLGFDVLKALRPKLVYASISAFGASGPWSKRPANDIIMQSVSGLMGITGEVGGGPVRIGAPISDFSSGLFMLSGVLAALLARDRHPEGQHVQVAMLEASLNMMSNYIPSVVDLGSKVAKLGRGHAQIVPYQAFLCADNEYLMIGAFTREFWQNLCRALDKEEWITDSRFASNPARLAHRAELVGELERIFATRNRDEWAELINAADVPNSPVFELHDAVHSEQVKHMHALMSVGEGEKAVTMVRNPIRVKAWGDFPARPAPTMGADTYQVLKGLLGKGDAEIDALVNAKIVAMHYGGSE